MLMILPFKALKKIKSKKIRLILEFMVDLSCGYLLGLYLFYVLGNPNIPYKIQAILAASLVFGIVDLIYNTIKS